MLFAVFCINLAYKYAKFQDFRSQNAFVNAKILAKYYKISKYAKPYLVIKAKTKDFSFYITSFDESFCHLADSIDTAHFGLRVGLVTADIGFKDYLKKSFYAPSFDLHFVPITPTFTDHAHAYITAQHTDPKIAELYSALFLATPISKELRSDVTRWGIAHLVAISGFHISVIFGVLYFLLRPIYRYFQAKFFPWRSMRFDLSVIIFGILLAYLFVLDFVPSYLRALGMGLLGFFLLVRNFRLINFANLFLTIAILIAFFPHLLFSIGFYFSVLGVFYIFVYIRHFWGKFGLFWDTLGLNIFVFLAMNIPVYYFFPTISIQQISVIFLTYIFSIFYPFVALLHLVGFGGLLDEILLKFLDFTLPTHTISISFVVFLLYSVFSILAIFDKNSAIIISFFGFLPLFLFLIKNYFFLFAPYFRA